jgi:hypothetical protein
MSGREAKRAKLGGEALFTIWWMKLSYTNV